MTPLDLRPDLDVIQGWDWLSSHDLGFLYSQAFVSCAGPQGSLSVLPRPTTPAPVHASVLIGHGKIRRHAPARGALRTRATGPSRGGPPRRASAWPAWGHVQASVPAGHCTTKLDFFRGNVTIFQGWFRCSSAFYFTLVSSIRQPKTSPEAGPKH